MQVLKAGALYFALVFGAGFVLGTIRVLWVVPHFGERTAELIEAPLMLGVTVLAAYWTVRYLATPSTPSKLLGLGFVALGLLLLAESTRCSRSGVCRSLSTSSAEIPCRGWSTS